MLLQNNMVLITTTSIVECMPTSKQIILCADDYAQSAAISKGILDLVQLKRLSAVSCMTQSPHWFYHAQDLLPVSEDIDLGLHFNLTHGFASDDKKLTRLIAQSLTGRYSVQSITKELHSQLDFFESALNRAPNFVDGHHHVHLFPGIRQVVLKTLHQRYPDKKPYLRLACPPLTGHDALLRALVLRFLAVGFKKEAMAAGFTFPPFFSGFYSLKQNANYPRFFQHCLQQISSGTLIMCHPALSASNLKEHDPIFLSRWHEYTYLKSPDFEQALNTAKVTLVRFKEMSL